MKKNILIILLFSLFFFKINAQNQEPLDYKNNITFNALSALLFGNLEVQYERAISENTTLSLAVGIKPSGGIIKVNGFNSSTIQTNNFEFSGITVTPEYRWYFQKNESKRTGLYLGTYYKFKRVSDDIRGTYTSSNTGTSAPLDVDIDITSHTIGALLGFKVMTGKHFYFDITIAGPGFGRSKLKIEEKQPLPAEFYIDAATEIIDNFDAVAGFLENIQIEETSPSSGDGSFGLPAFRYGVKIGYSF